MYKTMACITIHIHLHVKLTRKNLMVKNLKRFCRILNKEPSSKQYPLPSSNTSNTPFIYRIIVPKCTEYIVLLCSLAVLLGLVIPLVAPSLLNSFKITIYNVSWLEKISENRILSYDLRIAGYYLKMLLNGE